MAHTDIFTWITGRSVESALAHPVDPAPDLEIFGSSGVYMTISAANASIASESTENATLTFISSDHLATLNELTQGAEPLFDCQNKSAEGLPNTKPPLFRGRFSIRLLKSIGGHAPFTTFSIDPPETFPPRNSPHPTVNAARSFFSMYPDFQRAAPNCEATSRILD